MAVGDAYTVWLDRMEAGNKKVVVIECGAGLVIPSARCDAENIAERFGTTLVRINPRDDGSPLLACRRWYTARQRGCFETHLEAA